MEGNIKSTKIIKPKGGKSEGYPRLMININNKRVVYFHKEQHGICVAVSNTNNSEIGYYGDAWCMVEYEDFKGTLEISTY